MVILVSVQFDKFCIVGLLAESTVHAVNHRCIIELDTGLKDGAYSVQKELLAWRIRQKSF